MPDPQSVDVAALAAGAQRDETTRLTLKKMPLEYVANKVWGVEFIAEGDRLKALCPNHELNDGEEHTPSFHVWSDGDNWHWRCSPCDRGGDVFSLLQAFVGMSYGDSVAEATRLLAEMPAGWAGTRLESRVLVRPDELAVKVDGYFEELAENGFAEAAWAAWMEARGLARIGGTVEWLQEQWGVGGSDWCLCIPHYSRGKAITGYHLRTGDQKWSGSGSKFPALYGMWRDQGRPNVVLVEGESDAWAASLLWPDHDVLALPSGITRPREAWLDCFDGRKVLVAIDVDAASEPIAAEWVTALAMFAETAQRVRPKVGKDLGDHVAGGYGVEDLTIEGREIPSIITWSRQLRDVVAEAWTALERSNTPARIFRYGRGIARVRDGRIEPLTDVTLRTALSGAANWFKKEGDGLSPPLDVVRDMLATPYRLPDLVRISHVPVFRPDGTLAADEGYDAATRTWIALNGLEPPHPTEWPSRADALELLLTEWLGDFPFAGAAERAHALAFFLLPIVRDLIDGPTPLHLFDKPTPRTGASLLATVLAMPSLGGSPAVQPPVESDAEWRKSLTAILLDGDASVVLFDNVVAIDSPSLSAAITGTVWTDRILGKSEKVRIPIRAIWAATGNNPRLTREVSERSVRIRLDTGMENPSDRHGFRHPHLLAWTMEHRAELLSAGYALVRDWLERGRPRPSEVLAGLEEWSHVVGGILECAGATGWLANRSEVRSLATGDVGDMWGEVYSMWWSRHGAGEVKVSALMMLCAEVGIGAARTPQGLGRVLMTLRDRPIGGFIARRRDVSNSSLWRLEQVVA